MEEEQAGFDLDDSLAMLARTPEVLSSLLRGLPDSWTRSTEGPGTWSAFDVVGHLAYGETSDWMVRTRIILEQGESRAFDPFDREAQFQTSPGKTLEQLLDEFARLRRENVAALRALRLQPADLDRRGRHPSLGAVTLRQLLAAWVAHDFTHLHQLSRVLAGRYREAVGPWSAYMGVLQCAGHSAPPLPRRHEDKG